MFAKYKTTKMVDKRSILAVNFPMLASLAVVHDNLGLFAKC